MKSTPAVLKTKKSAATAEKLDGKRGLQKRLAAAVDPVIKAANQKRLRRIEGQIRGLQRMVAEDCYCPDIIVQVASAQEALRGVARNLMKNHLHHCVTKALRRDDVEEAAATYDELLKLIYAHLR